MAKPHYQHTFMIVSTNGEAETFFGANVLKLPEDQRPRLRITVRKDNCVTFKTKPNGAKVAVKLEDVAEARFLCREHAKWPNDGTDTDLIIGDIYPKDPKRRQLFIMWVKKHPKPKQKKKNLALGFYFFETKCRVSGGKPTWPLCEGGTGQAAGGGTGTGPH